MRIFNLILANLLVGMALNCAGAQAPAARPWSAATYHGLTVGTSTRADVLKVLGKPNFVGKEEDTGIPIITFLVSDPMPGTLNVFITKGILDGMRLDLNKTLTRKDIIRIFGHDYVVVHYAADNCIDTGGASPLYQNPGGPFKYMEYHDRGIAAAFAYDDDQKVDAIVFTYRPLAPNHSQCGGRGDASP